MPYDHILPPKILSSTDYTDSKPILGRLNEYAKTLKFANWKLNLPLSNTLTGYVELNITYTGTIAYGSIWFVQPNNGTVSVGTDLTKEFLISSLSMPVENVFYNDGVLKTSTYYILANGHQTNKNKFFTVYTNLGSFNPSITSITISYNCTPIPVYSYTMGFHAYSSYDAQQSIARLTTNLYSLIPISEWGVNTPVFSSVYLDIPALTYYYGYGSKVYKVGLPIKRSTGTISYMHIHTPSEWEQWWGNSTSVTEIIQGPGDWLFDRPNNGMGSPSCVVPTLSGIGIIHDVFDISSLHKPEMYQYYMGYDSTDIQLSNDSVFTYTDMTNGGYIPIVGSTHALLKTYINFISTYYKEQYGNWSQDKINQIINAYYVPLLSESSTYVSLNSSLVTFLFPPNHYTGFTSTYSDLSNPYTVPPPPYQILLSLVGVSGLFKGIGSLVGCASCYRSLGLVNASVSANALASLMGSIALYGVYLAILVAATYILYVIATFLENLLTSTNKDIFERCMDFIHMYTLTPYISTGDVIYSDKYLTTNDDGYYCDGIYFYQQTDGIITSKTLSSTNSLISTNPDILGKIYSSQVDNPTLITDFTKLMGIAYTSGYPEPYCGGNTVYYSHQTGYTKTNECCDLQICDDIIIDVPSGHSISCISQIDADNKADKVLSSLILLIENNNNSIPDKNFIIGNLQSYFTHEIKVENNPADISIYYDNTISGITIGKYLYYDIGGCTKVLNGYYSITGNTYYRTFYHTINGQIDGIYYMETSGSTTTTTSEPIITTNLEYTSNWFYTDISITNLSADIVGFLTYSQYHSGQPFNPNGLYTDPKLLKGFIKTPITYDNFQIYDTFDNFLVYNEAPTGWYTTLIPWGVTSIFHYYKASIITLNIEEKCGESSIGGYNIIGVLDGSETPTYDPVTVIIGVYDETDKLISTYNNVTSIVSSRTFYPFDSQITVPVSNIKIESIVTTNPINKTTYITGTTVMCCDSCDTGYTWTPTLDNTLCYRTDITGATSPSILVALSGRTSIYYSEFGTKLFSNYTSGGTGTYTTLTTPNLWMYTGGTSGPMNRCAVWPGPANLGGEPPLNTWIGFTQEITGLTSNKTYYVGVGADNDYRIIVNGVTVLDTGNSSSIETFTYWHIYPIQFNLSTSNITIEGYNLGSIAGFGVEIYDNTLTELQNATTIGNLNIIFTSHSKLGSYVDTGDGGYGYTCPAGYSPVYESNNWVCKKITYC